ncbi:uncharacterized protein CDV56_106200 [Aspergillus thermomutatus]|uniref:RCHY1 zinc-ribbon domain-containing protein n=1 Tax=Aspergillus thermomutatus TaxID=41047 RepID=A0A397HYB2_ASPTH|nr:uncharacterized protein CDV56_106200 [Aspergillus thermomutatus]RHZ66204.1 hypothetical protein CDV56_106200 [Aspergillus thermomutatus]
MSGLISSLLIEPVVRQARRLSNQTNSHPPYDDDLADSLPITRSSSSSATYNDDDRAKISSRKDDHETSTIGLNGDYSEAEGTHFVPASPAPSELSSRRHDRGGAISPSQSHSGTPVVSSQNLHGLSDSEHVDGVRPYAAPEVTGADSTPVFPQNMVFEPNPGAQESNHLSARHGNLDDTGDQFLLPEDDGMGVLRKKIHAIRDLQSSNEEKARMIHELMTESPQLSERSVTPISRCGSRSSDHAPIDPPSTASTSHQIEDTYRLTAEDLRPTFFPKPESNSPVCDFEDTDAEDVEEACLGCRHYKRNVKLQCFECKKCKTIANMESTFRNLDRTIQSQPMPAEFKDTSALIHCNDCGAKSVVRYHWLGLKCDMCESYNTAQIRLLHGEVLDSLDRVGGDNRDISASPTRSSLHGAEEEATIPLPPAQLRVDTSSPSGAGLSPRLAASSSAEQNGRFSSYSLTRGRAVSPVISNYFGLPPDRDSNRSRSTLPFFGDLAGKDSNDHTGGKLRLWGTKIKYKYGFLDRETESADGTSEVEEEGDDGDDSADGDSVGNDEVDRGDPEEDDDEDEGIDIFGHR